MNKNRASPSKAWLFLAAMQLAVSTVVFGADWTPPPPEVAESMQRVMPKDAWERFLDRVLQYYIEVCAKEAQATAEWAALDKRAKAGELSKEQWVTAATELTRGCLETRMYAYVGAIDKEMRREREATQRSRGDVAATPPSRQQTCIDMGGGMTVCN